MQMYANILRTSGNSELDICELIISGFTGQLNDWWTNYLNDEQVRLIKENVKKDERG